MWEGVGVAFNNSMDCVEMQGRVREEIAPTWSSDHCTYTRSYLTIAAWLNGRNLVSTIMWRSNDVAIDSRDSTSPYSIFRVSRGKEFPCDQIHKGVYNIVQPNRVAN